MSLSFKIAMMSVLIVPLALSALPPQRQLTAEELAARAERKARFNERTGGLIEKPGQGCVVVANAQTIVGRETVADASAVITREFRISQHVVEGTTFNITTAQDEVAKNKATVMVFIVNDPTLPMTLLAAEASWSVVNVAPLLTDSPSKEKLRTRFRKLFMRSASALLGAGASTYRLSVMQKVMSVEDLDALSGLGLDPQSLMVVMQHLQKMGMTAPRMYPYRKACQEGWAPPPTNQVQKAIWEQAKADRERGPTNPIVIRPNKK